jgi:hypothetical protein
VSDDHVAHAETRGEQVFFEAARADRRELRVEVQAYHAIDVVAGERLQLLAKPGEPRRRLGAFEILARCRLEGDDRRGQPELERAASQRGEHVLCPRCTPS